MTNFISRIFGIIASIKFPKTIQNFINFAYVNHFKIDMSEFKSYKDYKSLNALFTRTLLTKREISMVKESFLSPSDGLCFEHGISYDFKALSIKNHSYNIKELLDTTLDDKNNEKLSYINIYLSPKDYHHYHSPCDLEILECLYIPAKLYSVAEKYLIKIPNLYCKNERVILKCKMLNGGILWMVFVGALNVGKMKFDFDERIQTNAKKVKKEIYKYNNLFIKKGQHLGNFELGSTIVLIAQSEFINFKVENNQNLKYAQEIASLNFYK